MTRTKRFLAALLVLTVASATALAVVAQEPQAQAQAETETEAQALSRAVAQAQALVAAQGEGPATRGGIVVRDIIHTIQTILNGYKIYQQVVELRNLKAKAEQELKKLTVIPLADPSNFTGAFLAKTLDDLDQGSAWSFHRNDIEQVLSEHFVGVGAYAGVIDPNAYPPGGGPFSKLYIERQGELLSGLMRRYAILQEHTEQINRERKGLTEMRATLPGADGTNQHLEHIAAVLHQLADAQSVDRQIQMLATSQSFLDDMARISGEAETTALRLTAIFGWSNPEGMPLMQGGLTVAP